MSQTSDDVYFETHLRLPGENPQSHQLMSRTKRLHLPKSQSNARNPNANIHKALRAANFAECVK